MLSAPQIREQITDGRTQITGNFTAEEAAAWVDRAGSRRSSIHQSTVERYFSASAMRWASVVIIEA